MRRKIALILSMVLLVGVLFPARAFAQTEAGLEKAISRAKSLLNIPLEDFKLTGFDSYNARGRTVWNLYWEGKDPGKDGGIQVTIDENGIVESYYRYNPYDPARKKLPALSRSEAQKRAQQFLRSVASDIYTQLKMVEPGVSPLYDDRYYFNYYRVVNGIPFYSDTVSVGVDRNTGEALSFYRNWTDGLVFPDSANTISLEEAIAAYKEKLGLKLVYRDSYRDNELKVYPAFVPAYGTEYAIDAFTGEKVRVGYGYIVYDGGGMGGMAMEERAKAAHADGLSGIVLSPEELEAIEKVSKLITREEAEKIARGIAEVGLTSKYDLVGASLVRNWRSKDFFYWELSFQAKSSESYSWCSVSVDAQNGEVLSFYNPYDGPREGEKARFNREQAKKAADDLLKKLVPSRWESLEYVEEYEPAVLRVDPVLYSFTYIRKVNGIEYTGNYAYINYDAVNGKIYSYSLIWSNPDFPEIDKDISPDKAYETLFNEVGYELKYRIKYEEQAAYDEKPQVALVFDFKEGKPLQFDPESGAILGYDGSPYVEEKPVQYTDIAGHFAENQIKILAEFGIAFEGPEFRPEEKVLQKDFLLLLSKTLGYIYIPLIKEGISDKEVEDAYTALIREGIVKESEKAPDSTVTKEDAVKFLIRALRYDKVAEIKGIFKTDFKDEASIAPELVGYMAIAQGLGIIRGNNGYLNPKAEITRAQAILLLYYYLQV